MIDRILKNWKTTLVGVLILITGAVLVAIEKATLPEATAFLAVAIGLFFSKDKKTNAQ